MRVKFIDNAKAIAILLVVIGHTDGISKNLENFIFSFHMPAFFFISGFLLKDKKLNLSSINYLWIQIKSLVVPYCFFGIISILYLFVNSFVKGLDIDIYKIVVGFIYGNSEGLTNKVLWFFTTLFSTSILYYFLSKKFRNGYIFIISLVLSFIVVNFYKNINFRPPWNIDLSAIAMIFYTAGKYFSCKKYSIDSSVLNKILKIVLFVFLVIGLFFISGLNGRVDMAFMTFKNQVLFIINAFIGISILLLLGSSFPSNKVSLYLSKNTIIIFPLHPIIFSIFTGLGMIVFTQPHDFQNNIIWSIIYTCGALILCHPISVFLFRFFPIMLGGRK